MGASSISEIQLSKIQIIDGDCMLSLIVGCALGFWVVRVKEGLMGVLLYGVVAGVISANVSYHDAAGLFPVLLAFVSFGLARLIVGVRRARGIKLEHGQAKLKKNVVRLGSASERWSAFPKGVDDDREDLYVAAGLSHAAFVNVVGRKLDDFEFVASALGAFDGTVQALGRELSKYDMLSMGTAFALLRMRDVERMQGSSPGARGDLIGQVMVSQDHDELKAKSGAAAFAITQ